MRLRRPSPRGTCGTGTFVRPPPLWTARDRAAGVRTDRQRAAAVPAPGALAALRAAIAGLGSSALLALSAGAAAAVEPTIVATSPPPVMAPGVPPGGEDYGVPVRLRLPAIGIDLPVISSKVELPGNKPGYPLCDVAQYWTRYALPGLPGTTWIFGHARPGMMGPILENVQRTAGESLLGLVATVQVEDGRLFHYRIFAVKQHATDQAIALREDPAEQRLIIQTSEGPPGTIPKLQVATRLEAVSRTSEPPPDARPTMCWVPPAPVRRSTLIAIVASAGMLVVAGAVWHTRRRAGGGTGPPDDPGVRAAA